MSNLLRWPSPAQLRRLTGAALLVTLLMFLLFNVHDRPLAPYTIVSLELAFTPEQASEIFAAWDAAGLRVARESLLIDFAYMPAYALLFAGLTLAEARLASGRRQAVGLWLVLAPFVAWALDFVENAALLGVLNQPAAPPAAPLLVAGAAASAKFLLLLASVLYILLAYVVRSRRAAARASAAPGKGRR